MQLAIQLDFLQNFPAIGFKGGAEIVKFDAGKLGHHPVGGPAGNLPHQPVILALKTPAADQVVAFFDFFQKAGNFFRIVLQVPVHGNDNFPAGKIKTGFQRRGLAKIAAQTNYIHAAVVFVNIGENFVGIIFAAIVDEDHLVWLADGVHNFGELHVELRDAFLLVEERNHNRITDRRFTSHTTLRCLSVYAFFGALCAGSRGYAFRPCPPCV